MVSYSELWDTQAFWMLADEPIPVIIELELLGITSVHAWGNAQRWQISGVSPWIRIHVNTPVGVAADQAALGCHSMGDWQHAKLIITPVSTVVTEGTCRNGELSCSPEFRFDVHICDQCRLVPQQLQAHNTPCHKSISKSIRSSRWVSRWDKMCEASLECVTYDVVQRCYFISKIAPQKRALSLWFEL